MLNICSREDILKLYSSIFSFRLFNDKQEYQFNLPDLSDTENQLIKEKFNIYKNECGCFIGSIFLASGIFLLTIYIILSGNNLFETNITQLLNYFLFIICCALTGKIVGIVKARYQLYRLLGNILYSTNTLFLNNNKEV